MAFKGISSNLWVWSERYSRDSLEIDWHRILEECRIAGVDAIELLEGLDISELALSKGLKVSSAYVGLPLHESGLAGQIKERVLPLAEKLARVGGTDLLVNADPKGGWVSPQLKTEDDFKTQGENLSTIAELVEPLGLRVSMHNHAATRHNAEGDLQSVVRYSSESVGLCIDTGWAYTAGHDPLEWVSAYPGRIYAIHLRNQVGSVPTEDLLSGDIPVEELIRAMRGAHYDGWLTLELWHPNQMQPTGPMRDAVKRSVEWLAKM